jgi:exodeoxyribonuclease V beta subunit
MVAACNRFFGHAERHPRGAFRFRTESEDPIPYHQVEARGRDERLILQGREVPAMTFWTLECAESAIGPEDYRRELAAAAATEIVRWLRQARADQAGFLDASAPLGTPPRPLQPKDIAILVRKGSEAVAMRAALARRGINSVYLSDRDSVFQTPEARDLLHWLRACAAPGDEDLVRAALATNTLAMPLEELAELRGDELAWEMRLERFRDYQQIWQRQGVLAMLHRLMHEAGLPARLLAREGGERSLTNLLHLAEWLQSAAVGLDGEQALIRHLTAHLEVTGEEFIVRLESDAELVQVVTIHKSKGLEYPLVLLPFICAWREVDGHTRQVPYRAANERLLEVAGKEAFAEAWDAADDERLSEDMRLLYVAVTRARHAVWLGIAPLKGSNSNKPRLERSALGYLLDGGQAFADAAAITEALERVRGDSPDIAIVPLPPADETRLPPASNDVGLEAARAAPLIRHQPWWIASYSALRIGTIATERIAMGTADAIETDASPRRVTAAAETAAQDTASEEAAAREAAEPLATAATLASATRPDSGPDLHGLPRGQAYGTFLHGLLEWAAAQRIQDESGVWREGYAAAAIASGPRRDMLARRCRLRGLTPWITTLETWLGDLLERRWTLSGLPDERGQVPTLALSELAPHQIQVEMELLIESHQVHTTSLDQLAQTHCLPGQARPPIAPERLNGMLKGFIDLVFEHAGRYYVLDWKSNWLGPDDSAYTPEAMRAAILHHRYDLQYLLYLLALHRQLTARLPGYQYERDVGGVVYVFLRGSRAPSQGLYMDKPPRVLIECLDQLFAGVSPPQDPWSSR